MSINSGIVVSISSNSKDIEPCVRAAFSDLDCDINSDYYRKSAESLSTQIIIFLEGCILSGATWDLIKLGISKLFRKHNEIVFTIRDNDGIMFAIKKDWKVVALVTPNRQKEFSKIKNIHDLERYLVAETEIDKLEHRRRFDSVLGITLAGILGWLINIFSNIYYDVYLTHSTRITSYNSFQLSLLISFLFLVVAFLQFLVYDYKNELTLGKNFWLRYISFISENSPFSRIARLLNRLFLIMFLIIFDFSILSVLYSYVGYLSVITILFVSFITIFLITYIRKTFKR